MRSWKVFEMFLLSNVGCRQLKSLTKIVTATVAVGLALKGTIVASSPVRIVSTRFGGRAQKASNFS